MPWTNFWGTKDFFSKFQRQKVDFGDFDSENQKIKIMSVNNGPISNNWVLYDSSQFDETFYIKRHAISHIGNTS